MRLLQSMNNKPQPVSKTPPTTPADTKHTWPNAPRDTATRPKSALPRKTSHSIFFWIHGRPREKPFQTATWARNVQHDRSQCCIAGQLYSEVERLLISREIARIPSQAALWAWIAKRPNIHRNTYNIRAQHLNHNDGKLKCTCAFSLGRGQNGFRGGA